MYWFDPSIMTSSGGFAAGSYVNVPEKRVPGVEPVVGSAEVMTPP
jgi:hypothetical protein